MPAYVIDDDFVVPLGEGELVFENPGHAAFVEISKLDEDLSKPIEERGKRLFQELSSVKNLKYKNDEEVTVESLQAGNFKPAFYRLVKTLYENALLGVIVEQVEAAKKKMSTPGSSNG